MKELVRGFLEINNVNEDLRNLGEAHNNLVTKVDQLSHSVSSLQAALTIMSRELSVLQDKEYIKAVKASANRSRKRKN